MLRCLCEASGMNARARLASCLRRLLADRTAGVSTLATLALPVVIGSAGLAFDLNRGFEQRIANQRAADMAALGTALAFSAKDDTALLDPTARAIAAANGQAGAQVEATLLANYPEDGAQAVEVEVRRSVPFALARVLGLQGSYAVRARAVASIGGDSEYAAPCYLALSASSGAIETSGGASVLGSSCSVAALGSIIHGGGTMQAHDIISGSGDITMAWNTLLADTLRFAGSFVAPQWNTNVPAESTREKGTTELSDPWATNAAALEAQQQLGSYTQPGALSNPVTPAGSNWDFNWSPDASVSKYRKGSSNKYVVPKGNYTIGRLSVGGGIEVTFEPGSRITIAGGLNNTGSSLTFGSADLYVNGGFNSGNGVTIGDGALWIGSGTVTLGGTNVKGNGDVVVNAPLAMGGNQHLRVGDGAHAFQAVTLGGGSTAKLGTGSLTVPNGITIGGGSAMAVGAGTVTLGKNAGGNAVDIGGASRLLLSDGQFSANGNIAAAGGSMLVFGETTNHLINGNLNVMGSVLFGAGRYTVNGNFVNGTGGSDKWPYYSSLSGATYGASPGGVDISGYEMAGVDVTFILSGTMNLAGGTKIKLFAPQTSRLGGPIAELLLHSLTSADTIWSGGANRMFSGTIHLPNSKLSMSGGNGSTGGGRCMTLIASSLKLSGGAATGSACSLMAQAIGGGGGTIRLLR